MNDAKRSLNRMERLVEVRQSYVAAAEAGVREAEAVVRHFEEQAEKNARQIQQSREEIAYLKSATALNLQARERHIFSLNFRAQQISQDLEKATKTLERKRAEWREAMKAKRIVERVQERRLQEWRRAVDVMEQKRVDEISVGRHARNQSRSSTEPHKPGAPSRSGEPVF